MHPTGLPIPQLPPDLVIEVPCVIDGRGARPLPVAPLDLDQLGLIAAVRASERAVIAAVLTGSREQALRAFVIHPLVGSPAIAERLLADLIVDEPALAAHLTHDQLAAPSGRALSGRALPGRALPGRGKPPCQLDDQGDLGGSFRSQLFFGAVVLRGQQQRLDGPDCGPGDSTSAAASSATAASSSASGTLTSANPIRTASSAETCRPLAQISNAL